MPTFDWSKFSCKIYIHSTIDQVYAAWSTSAGLEKWFLRKAEFSERDGKIKSKEEHIQIGNSYEWFWHGHPDTTVEHGTITDANSFDRIQFVFGAAGIVSVDLKQVGTDTELVLTQEQIPTDEHGKTTYHVGCSTGWTFYLANIKSVLEGSLDLRNKNTEYTHVINS